MIHATDKLHTLLAQDERVIDVLASVSPAFEKLRDASLRGTMARLVTVEQAATIARMDVASLIDRLNQVLDTPGGAPPPSAVEPPRAAEAAAVTPVPAHLLQIPPDKVVDADVREELRAGREPFRSILDAARATPPGGVLRVRAIFEPAPLYPVLAKQGFSHFTERIADDDWRVWFHRERDASAAFSSPQAAAPPATPDGDVIVLDVRGLEPPEPMERTLEALASMPQGQTLVQINVRVPQFLLPRLEERGFTYEIREQSADCVRLFIRHKQAQGPVSPDQPEQEHLMANMELDIRVVPPSEKHPTIFRTFDALPVGGTFTLINDHDPFPLRHQFEATRTGKYSWEYTESGPTVWRVNIGRTA